MAEVLVRFSAPVRGDDGRFYWAQACGGLADDGLWEGWLEFEKDGIAIRSARETEQPERDDLMYWAQGLSMTYLEGALDRARRIVETATPERRQFLGSPRYDRPAGTDREVRRGIAVEAGLMPRAILDPFAVFAEGESILRQQLNALSPDQLRNIAAAYRLDMPPDVEFTRPELAEAIVRAVATAGRPNADPDAEAAQGHA